ncbi:MAG TPA: sugar phosphate isomerase/epimerase family protein [Sedimentisphaerales bacterium]|nr:sugar phosphate isomerase/epimerase family protein [Sedimentisphaerales bacterium]
MRQILSRREFLAGSVSAAVLGMASRPKSRYRVETASGFRKAVIVNKPDEEILRKVKDAGFDGVEAGVVEAAEAAKVRETAERLGMRVHSVMRGWAKFNSENGDEVGKSFAVTVDALHAAKAYGAEVILLVPGRLDIEPMPKPWEFRVEFDSKTGHLTKVAEKGNELYGDYIAAHNRAYDVFEDSIGELISTAEKTGVVIAIENVWNNMFVDPRHAAHFIDSFESPWVRAYFDIGNHVKYSGPERWIKVLGKRIVRCHVKDFRLNADGRGGRFVDIREGSVDWAGVIKALEKVGYRGWMTLEGSEKLSLEERSRRLDAIITAV